MQMFGNLLHRKTMKRCCRLILYGALLHAMIVFVGSLSPLAFYTRHSLIDERRCQMSRLFGTLSDSQSLLEDIRSMRVKEIKAELSSRSISSADAFEKEELVKRLFEARRNSPTTSSQTTTTTNGSTDESDVVRSTLYLTSMDSSRVVCAQSNAELSIEPSKQPYATVQIEVGASSNTFPLSLLLDTACSGFVLRPSVVQKYNLPSYSTPVTMTGAAGVAGGTGLTQISQFTLGGGSKSFGPLPAAVQDIGALPTSLDGILGLSFLSQFACVEMNFRQGSLALYKKERRPPVPQGLQVVAEAEMSLTKLGIWTVDVTLDGRGPVKMLVDSGAACTFLNWKGVAELGLSRDSPLVERLSSPMGAMGSDNVAMELTHRLTVRQNVNIGQRPSKGSSGFALTSDTEIKVDVGEIGVLGQLASDNVGGILGIDVLMRCAVARLTFSGPVPRILLMN